MGLKVEINKRGETFIWHLRVDTECKLNVHKTFRRCPGRLLNILCTFNLHPVSTGLFPLSPGCFFVCSLQMALHSPAVLTPAVLVADTSLTHS